MVSIVMRTVIIYLLTSLFMRLTGKRQIGEMQVSELVTTILVSELCAQPVANPGIPLAYGVIPVMILLVFEVMLSFFASRSAKVKRLLVGTPSLIITHGEIDREELERARIGPEELMAELRAKDIASLSDVAYAILETNGKMSVITEEYSRPPSRADVNAPAEDTAEHPVVVDGRMIAYARRAAGKSEKWVSSHTGNVPISDIYLMTVTAGGRVRVIRK